MPIHDWTRVRANRFHDFHQGWTIAIRNALNGGLLPPGFFALAEQIHVPCPLEATYQATWDVFPALLKGPLEQPAAMAGKLPESG